MILQPRSRGALERALSTVKAVEDALRFMEEISKVSEAYQLRTANMRKRQEYIIKLAETGLVADQTFGNNTQ